MSALRPWQLSILLHALLAGAFVILTKISLPAPEVYEVPIYTEPVEIQKLTEVKEEKPKIVLKSVNEQTSFQSAREVFGANRNSYTDDSVNEAEAVRAKKGNTLAKSTDSEALKDDDATSLPEPTEEYLVSRMPKVISEVRPVYPKEARDKKIEGKVVMDILIDQNGVVRQANVVEGEDIFRTGAIDAMKKFKFKAAEVDGRAVAVKIRYTLRFLLEY
jgi:TonB family protein